mmetsp:Transcript_15700/g.50603  ORF Transcript_15700/g.50603 Transcript_15700/m.50603 type:complete len:280 (+) Transcript_15700:351-1190(+)
MARKCGETDLESRPIPTHGEPLSLSTSYQNRFGAPCPARARLMLPHPERETAAVTRLSAAAVRTARPPPYETPAVAMRDGSACQSAARVSTVSSTRRASSTSSGPAAVTSPSDSHQPRATYISTTYPAAAHSCCLTAYSHQFITHELQRTTTGKRRVASAAPALGYATTAFSRAPPTPLMASSSHSTDNPPGFRSPRPPACARPSSDSVTRELANRPAFPTSPPNRVLASPTPSATDCLTCSSGAGSTSDDAGKEREPACAPAVPIWELTASSVSSADT